MACARERRGGGGGGRRGGGGGCQSIKPLPLLHPLILLLILLRSLGVSPKLTIYSASGTDADLYLEAGEPLVLFCRSGALNISSVVFERGNDPLPPALLRLPLRSLPSEEEEEEEEEDVVQLEIRETQSNGNGETFVCSSPETGERSGIFVWIGTYPEVARNISFWSNNLEKISVEFCFNKSTNWHTRWTLSYIQRNSSSVAISFGQFVDGDNFHLKRYEKYPGIDCSVITWTSKDIAKTSSIDVTISGKNVLNDVTNRQPNAINFTFNPLDAVIPGPVKRFIHQVLNSTALRLTWRNPSRFPPTILPLVYRLVVQSEWNETKEFSNDQMTSRSVRRQRHRRDDERDDVTYSLVVDSLVPSSAYDVSIRARTNTSRWFWSEQLNARIQMPDDVPSKGPEILEVKLGKEDCDGNGKEDCRRTNATVIWRFVDRRASNGVMIGYNATWRELDPGSQSVFLSTAFEAPSVDRATVEVVVCQRKIYSVEVTACNSIGCSAPSIHDFSSDLSPCPPQSHTYNRAVYLILALIFIPVAIYAAKIAIVKCKACLTIKIKCPEKYSKEIEDLEEANGSYQRASGYAECIRQVEPSGNCLSSPQLDSSDSKSVAQTTHTMTSSVSAPASFEDYLLPVPDETVTSSDRILTAKDRYGDVNFYDGDAKYSHATARLHDDNGSDDDYDNDDDGYSIGREVLKNNF